MTSRGDLKNAFERLDRVQEELFGLVLDDPIEILDKNERRVLFEVHNVDDLYDLEEGTILHYRGESFTKTVSGDWASTSKGRVDSFQMFKFLLFGGQFKCLYDPGVGE